MARVRWHGTEFKAEPIRENPDGTFIMKALEHGPRFSIGTEIMVTTKEIVSMDAAEKPAPEQSLATLQQSLAAEREVTPLPDLKAKVKAPET